MSIHSIIAPSARTSVSATRKGGLRRVAVLVAIAASFASLAGRAYAAGASGLQGPQVAAGAASIVQAGKATSITAADKTIINWRGFNISLDELVKFIQPGPNAVVLNRVTGADPSSILGQLIANGRVFLINPNGVLFGANSKVDVAGLTATTF